MIAEKYRVIAELVPEEKHRRFEIEIHEWVSKERLAAAQAAGTVKNSRLVCPHCGVDTPIEVVRRGLRLWENEDLVPRPEDVYQERLYCIRWVETYVDEQGREGTRRHYRAPTIADLAREQKVLDLLRERFHHWQEQGYIPSRRIESGEETDEPTRTRGWTYWHHLFTPRQLLIQGLLSQSITSAIDLIRVGNTCDFNGFGA